MAEIKSAIELAMERTRDLVVSGKEREAMASKEVEDRVKAVLRRYVEEMIDADNASKELSRINVDEKIKKSVITNALVEEFELHKDNERLFALFNTAGVELPQSLRDELEKLYEAFQKEVSNREVAARKSIENRLAGIGISGSALELNLNAWEEWQKEVEKAGDVFQKNMESLKEKVKASNRSL